MTDCAAKHAALLALLEQRFAANMSRHPSHQWSEVKQRLLAAPDKLTTIQAMQDTGGALFADRRYNQVFVYHNGAESYYAARGFRGTVSL